MAAPGYNYLLISLLKKKKLLLGTWRLRKCAFSKSFKTDIVKLIFVDFTKSEFRNIQVFNRYKAFYLACSITIFFFFLHLDFIRALGLTLCRFHMAHS